MCIPEINYNYHDSYIAQIHMNGMDVELHIVLYPIFYPEQTTIKVTFEHIFNFESVGRYFNGMLQNPDPDGLSCTIYSLDYNTKKESKVGNIHIFLNTVEGGLKIHCQRMSEENINHH